MMPARQRTRSYDSAKIRAAVLAQFGRLRDAVGSLTEEQLGRPAHLGDWTVRELAVHIAMAMEAVSRALDQDPPARRDLALLDYPFATARFAGANAEGIRAVALDETDLGALYARTADRIAERLAGAPDERLLAGRMGAMTLADFLVTRTVELVVHTDDLNRAAGLDLPLDRQALAACTRFLADALAAKAPGGSTEVRIPPYAVVQCVEGPRHTRGTPPNVVETDPLTWVRLATGRTDWATETEAARVGASGERADLSGLLPIME
ncbi:sterol carrier family protein [Streptomyces sp. NPDC002004]